MEINNITKYPIKEGCNAKGYFNMRPINGTLKFQTEITNVFIELFAR